MIVTDVKWVKKKGKKGEPDEIKSGFYMDGWLCENVSGIPRHIRKDWDCIGIVSGSGKVRVAKSTMAMQIGYYVAWLLAGGEICFDKDDLENYRKIIKIPNQEVKFNLDNVCFDVETLMKKGHSMPRNSVIVYDEGREGLDAKSTMRNINRTMEEFLQQCGVYNHFLIIVLPDFFSLNKSFATARSNFLINVYHSEEYERGFFDFFSERKKEQLYVFGRRLLGNFARYSVTSPDFSGRFTKWMPFDKDEYEKIKRDALSKIRLSERDLNLIRQRDIFISEYKIATKKTSKEIEQEIFEKYGLKITGDVVRRAMQLSLVVKEKKLLVDEQKLEKEEE